MTQFFTCTSSSLINLRGADAVPSSCLSMQFELIKNQYRPILMLKLKFKSAEGSNKGSRCMEILIFQLNQ